MSAFILGGAQTDFARSWSRAGLDISDMMREAADDALADAGVDAVDVVHVGNFGAELFRGQGHLGSLIGEVTPALAGVPASRHEAACASGGVAVLAALADLAAGFHDLALVLGVEEMRNVPGQLAASHLGAAAWVGRETEGPRYLWPAFFSRIADEYDRRYRLDRATLGEIARSNLAAARRNPLAHARTWTFGPDSFGDDDAANPVIEGRIRRQDCGQVTDGAAALVLASPRAAEAHAARRGLAMSSLPRVAGWGHTTAPIALAPKLADAGGLMFPHVASAAAEARRRAGLDGPAGIDGFELHDCFTITELLLIEHLGLAGPGRGREAVERGDLARINRSGGLIGCGHPVGASGVRMVLDSARQVAGRAGDTQVEGARRFQTLNIGGSFATVTSFVVER
jgi:acetyl-CoA C-acetyltransferase